MRRSHPIAVNQVSLPFHVCSLLVLYEWCSKSQISSSLPDFTWIIVLAVVSVVAVLVVMLYVVHRDWISAFFTAHFKQQNKTG